jgi:hypothetical protein
LKRWVNLVRKLTFQSNLMVRPTWRLPSLQLPALMTKCLLMLMVKEKCKSEKVQAPLLLQKML